MSHRLNAAVRANKQLCRLNRAPVLAAELSVICADSSACQAPVVTTALGDLVTQEHVVPLCNPATRATLARAVAMFQKMQRPSLTAVQLKAITFSEMTMSCVGEVTGTIGEMTEARNKLKAILRARPPTEAEVQTVFTSCWTALSQLSGTSAYRVEDLEGFTRTRPEYNEQEVINQRVYQAWAHGCGIFDPNHVRPAAASEAWMRVVSIVTPARTVNGCDMNISDADRAALTIDYDQFLQAWQRGTLDFYCGYYDAQSWVEKTTTERDVVHALFTCLAHLSKGQNKTTAWINTRFRRVQEHIVGLSDLDAPVVQEFSKMHGGSAMSSEQIFAALAATYKCLSDTPAASLCWVIEQAVASNITGALTVADVISKLQFFPLSAIIGKVIPESEFKALVRLTLHTLVNKFGSLAGPTVTVKEYADIAHLAMAIYRKGLRGTERGSLVDYAGEYTQYLKLNKVDLDAMANNIQAISAGTAANSVSLAALIRSVGLKDATVGELDGEPVVFEDMGPSERAHDEDALPIPEGALMPSRVPQEMRRNKRFYKAFSVQAILSRLQDEEDSKSKSFRFLMGELATCGIQSSAYFADIMTRQYQLPYTHPNADVREHLTVWLGDEVSQYLAEHPQRSLNSTTGTMVEPADALIYPNHPVYVTAVPAPPAQPAGQ